MAHRFAFCLALSLAAAPVAAQDGEGALGDGFDLFSEGSRLILEGLIDEIAPMLDEARPLLREEIAPVIARLAELIDDLSAYELPERLPNGDIIIRRRPDMPPMPEAPVAPETGGGDVVEL